MEEETAEPLFIGRHGPLFPIHPGVRVSVDRLTRTKIHLSTGATTAVFE